MRATGEAGTGRDRRATLKPVRVNNAVRSAIDAALGSLQLFSPDASTRLHAAEAVFTSHDPAALAGLGQGAGQGNRSRGQAAHGAGAGRGAAVSRRTPAEADRLAAVAIAACARRPGRAQPACSAGRPVAGRSPPPPPPRWPRSIASCNSGASLQSVYYGISLGSVLLLAAAGLAITFGVMGVINMAHGEMVMIGAYVTFVVQQLMHAYLPSLYQASLLFAVPLAFLVSGVRRHRHRAQPDPLAVRPAAGNAAGDLGPVAGAAAGVRSLFGAQQPGRRYAGLDERRHAARRPDADLEPAVHHPVRVHGAGRADGGVALHAAGPAHARGDAEPADGGGDGHPHAVDRRADLRPGLRRRRHRRRGAVARSTTSRPISGRATSSTASWSWCSAASAICGAPRWAR